MIAGHLKNLSKNIARAKKETVAEILGSLVIIGRAQRSEKRGTFTACGERP